MKKYRSIIPIIVIAIAGIFHSCGDDFLTLYPRNSVVAGAPATLDVIEQNLTSVYRIGLHDCYANGTWMPVNLYFDICSDDLYKGGGDATDQVADQLVAEYRSTPVRVRTGWWSIFYTGLKRANGTLEAIENAVDVREETLSLLKAEALTLRAYYGHWLWKAHGNIPYYDKAWTEEPFLARQHTFEELYPILIADLDAAIATEEFPMSVSGASKGRVTKAMAMMTKARIVMYMKDTSKYAEVLRDMNAIINEGSYRLVTSVPSGSNSGNTANPVEWIFLREGEFSSESIFEVLHRPFGTGWSSSWSGYGNYTPRFISPRSYTDPNGVLGPGWGFAPVQRSAYAIFDEDGDYRKEASVRETPTGTYSPGFQNTGLWVAKQTARMGYNVGVGGDPDLNFENNKRIYRVAEAYLNAAELSFYASGQAAAQPYLDAIRDRAFGNDFNRIPATLNNIKLERRKEFFGEGMRFWDLIRWGSNENGTPIKEVLSVNDPANNIARVWDDTKRFLPIPQNEIDRTKGTEYELKQNPGYEN
jgi:hypothetical protein